MQEKSATTGENYQPRRHRRRIGSICLKNVLERPPEAANNDPLAHLYRLAEARDFEEAEAQIKTEFITDISERSKDKHFYGVFDYSLVHDDLLSSTGLSLTEILDDGLSAAQRDRIPYGIARAEALQKQLPMIVEWARSDDERQLAFFSLAPEGQELDLDTAKRLNFKPERQMSSNWVFEKTATGIKMHCFSLDGHSLYMHNKLLARLCGDVAESTSLEELLHPRYFALEDGEAAVRLVQKCFDELQRHATGRETYFGINKTDTRSANDVIKERPEAYALYKEAVLASYEALSHRRVTRRFKNLCRELSSGYRGFESSIAVLRKRHFQTIDKEQMAELFDYLRGIAIPHYLYGEETGALSIAASGAAAVSKGLRYEGACPTSEQQTPEAARAQERAKLEVIFFGRPLRVETFTSRTCPCCLPKPIDNISVTGWVGDGFIGCEDCGHVEEICGDVVRYGDAKLWEKRKKISTKREKQSVLSNKSANTKV